MNKFKMLGLGTIVLLALAAFPGAAAAATGFAADKYGLAISGTAEGKQTFAFNGSKVECNKANVSAVLPAPTERLTAYTENSTCSSFGVEKPLEMNGCHFEMQPETESFDIGPPGCGPIKTTLSGCPYSIGAQTGLDASYTNVGSGNTASVRFAAEVSNLVYTVGGSWPCSPGTHSNGAYSASWNLSGGGIGVRVEELAIGAFVTGKESANPAEQPRFEAEQYPVRLIGDQLGANNLVFKTNAGNVKCQQLQFQGKLTQAGSSFTSGATYGGCTALGIAATVAMNSCAYEFHLDNAGPPYTGTLDVDCSTPGDAIEFKSPACTTKIVAQSGLKGVGVTNTGSGIDRGFETPISVSGIQYVSQKHTFLCPAKAGSFSDGTLTGTVDWRGMR